MSKILSTLILVVFCLIIHQDNKAYCYNKVYTQQNVGYVTDLNLALNLSKETKQEVLLIFSASWCKFCDKLKVDLSSLEYLDNRIICILDSDQEKKLSRQFKVKTLPSSFLINSDGNTISTITGYDFNSYNKWLTP